MPPVVFEFEFTFQDGTLQRLVIEVDKGTFLQAAKASAATAPDWTRLEFHQCTHCPFNPKDKPHCPVALNLSYLASHFSNRKSFEKVSVRLKTEERWYGKSTDLQTALQSVFGLSMATSECPHFDFYRALARFHLPFATFTETSVRIFSFYLMQQFFEAWKDGSPSTTVPVDLNGLTTIHENLSKVNSGMIRRIRSTGHGDAGQNALVILDNFAALLPLEIEMGLKEIEVLFKLKKHQL